MYILLCRLEYKNSLQMVQEFENIFIRLKKILQRYEKNFSVRSKYGYYCIVAAVGPATIKAWGGKMKKPIMPVGWVETQELQARMQGKTCFNFKNINETLFNELEQLTKQSIEGFKKAGYIS